MFRRQIMFFYINASIIFVLRFFLRNNRVKINLFDSIINLIIFYKKKINIILEIVY